jgi:hypothetical protein
MSRRVAVRVGVSTGHASDLLRAQIVTVTGREGSYPWGVRP